MSATGSAKRSTETGGVKTVISALSIAAVVGGWAGYTLHNKQQSTEQTVQYEETQDDANRVSLELAPIPTLVSAPNFQAGQAQGTAVPTILPTALPNVSLSSASSGSGSGGQVRVVRQGRQPATNTNSSRP